MRSKIVLDRVKDICPYLSCSGVKGLNVVGGVTIILLGKDKVAFLPKCFYDFIVYSTRVTYHYLQVSDYNTNIHCTVLCRLMKPNQNVKYHLKMVHSIGYLLKASELVSC